MADDQTIDGRKAPALSVNPRVLGYGVFGFVALVLLVGFSLFSFDVWPFGMEQPGICKEADYKAKNADPLQLSASLKKAELMCDVRKAMLWYQYHAKADQFVHSTGLLVVILLTLATSFLLGSGWTQSSGNAKNVAVALPLLSAAVAAVLSQFNLQESLQLREMGRIKADEIYHDVSSLEVDEQGFRESLQKLRKALVDLEYDQATKYFSYRFAARDADDQEEIQPLPADE